MADEPYGDPSVPTDERVADLLARMTVPEKAGQLAGFSPDLDESTIDEAIDEIATVGFGSVSPTAVALSADADATDVAHFVHDVQRAAVEETRLGIPALTASDATHGHAFVAGTTVFPHGLGMAATRDPGLIERVSQATAREMRATGVVQNYAPIADVARDPRWGRTFETYGESPYLAAACVEAAVRGYRGGDVAPTAKHFPAYGEPVRGEDTAPVDRPPAYLHRVFLPPFHAAVGASVDAVMPSYNSIDGVPVHASPDHLRDRLRTDLGSEAVVVSDWNGVAQLHEDHFVAGSWADAVRQTVEAGLDIASIGGRAYAETLVDAVERGDIDEARLDESVRRVLRLKVELGLFEEPVVDADDVESALRTDAHQDLAREAARRTMTLLANEGAVLPFDPSCDAVAVVGPNADDPVAQCGGWTRTGRDESVTTIRDGIEAVVDESTDVRYEPGTTIRDRLDAPAAREAAADADVAVVALGEDAYVHEFVPPDWSTDHAATFPRRQDLSLPEAQRALLEAVHATGTPTALVLVTGRPLAIPWAATHVPGILMAYYPGADGGLAVAETLFGAHNPSGRLPISVPQSTGHLPTRFNHLPHPSPVGDGAHQPSYDPLFAFGHGLSYTSFERSQPTVTPETVAPDESVTVSVDVRNAGDRPGRHALDVFVRDEVSSRVTPVREWRGMAATSLAPGDRETLSVRVDGADLGVVQPDGRRVVEPGEFTVIVGEDTAGFAVRES